MSILKVGSLRHYDADSDALILSSSGTITFNGAITNQKIPVASSDPSGTATGLLYFNTVSGAIKVYDGSTWATTAASSSLSLDGGFSSSTYTAAQLVDGGSASG